MPRRANELKLTAALFFGPVACSIALAFVAWSRRELAGAAVLVLLVAAACAWPAMSALDARGRPLKWFLVLSVPIALIVVPELAMRSVGFRHQSGIEFGFPRPSEFVRFVRDDKLFWKMHPDRPEANSMGFPGKLAQIPKPAGLARVLFLGDSCTQLGYPVLVEERLLEMKAGGPAGVECISLAVAGYTSHQGRVLAETLAPRTEPDLVVVFFGWNDHWLAYGAPDSQKVMTDTATGGALEWLSEGSRLVQWLLWAGGEVLGSRGSILDVTRVSHAEYRENLLRIAEVFAELAVPVVFITAPTSHRVIPPSDWLVDLDFAKDKESIIRLHGEYTDIVREVAKQTGQHLLELEREFDAKSAEELGRLFREDGIHYTPAGERVVAERVAGFLAGLL